MTFRAEGAVRLLSNLARTPFLFRGTRVASSSRQNDRVRAAGCGEVPPEPEALAALISRRGARLVHDTGKAQRTGSALSAERFTAILEKIRSGA